MAFFKDAPFQADSSSNDSDLHSTSGSNENESEGKGFLSPYENVIIQNKGKLDKKKKEVWYVFDLWYLT